MAPTIDYARSGGLAIAYQVAGAGDVDLVYVPDYMSNLVYGWESPRWRGFYERLTRTFRLILFDKRGTGLSDHGGQFAALETRMEDLGAVLAATGSERPVVLAANEGCCMAALYAATYPERTRALILFQPVARGLGLTDETSADLRRLRDGWGTQAFSDELLEWGCRPLWASEEDRTWFANWLRVGATPAVAYALNRAFFETDLRDVLPAVRVPTLVLYTDQGADDALDVASSIPDALAVRLAGDHYFGIFLSPEVADETERFLAGEKAPAVPESVLLALLFTDIVGSTEHAAQFGDQAWRDALDRHHTFVRRELARFRGEERDTAGDGFFATFDGPARAIRCAQSIVDGVQALGLNVRAGIHVGECELHDGKVAGIALSIGARVAAQAAPDEVLVSSTVRDLVAGSGIAFAERGTRELKGVPGTWALYAAVP